ncbi:unnamed protein product [Trifolium pratense]|uniref:Uncharacterized protein n=1 Tax=Trifolium pratense TaxID=57577 RepID=A0ACB0K6B0_TRIPR|nr:unnamed protein product [Trifolium pratense]
MRNLWFERGLRTIRTVGNWKMEKLQGLTKTKIPYTDLKYLICKFCILANSEDVDSAVQLQFQVERVKSTTISLRRILLSPSFSEFSSENGIADVMEEDAISSLSTTEVKSHCLGICTSRNSFPSCCICGISDTVIEDRFGVKHGTAEWYEALDQHFKWLLQYRISPYFCKWADGMSVLTYTCPWPADHPKSDEYFSDPRLAAYICCAIQTSSLRVYSQLSPFASVRNKLRY